MQWQFVRRSWTWLGTGVVVAAAGTAGLLFVFHGAFVRGLILVAAVVRTFGGLWSLVVQLTGTGPLSVSTFACPQLRATPPDTVRPAVFLWGGTGNAQKKPADVLEIDGCRLWHRRGKALADYRVGRQRASPDR